MSHRLKSVDQSELAFYRTIAHALKSLSFLERHSYLLQFRVQIIRLS